MQVCDPAMWARQRSELQADPTGKDFLAFLETWVHQAEELLGQDETDPATALRRSLDRAESVHGRIAVQFVGQMLVVIAAHWTHGDDLISQLTPIEMRLVQDMLAIKLAELQSEAAATGDQKEEL